MMMTDVIEQLIQQMLSEQGGEVELRRNDLALKVGCVPSQINYVISSRFTPEKGYIIESRRGGGGYVRITKVKMTRDQYLMHFFHAIGNELDIRTAHAFIRNLSDQDIITPRERNIITSVFKISMDDIVRADMMRQIILAIMK